MIENEITAWGLVAGILGVLLTLFDMVKNRTISWRAGVGILVLLLSSPYWLPYWIKDDGTQPHKGNGIEENRESNILESPQKETNQKPPKDLVLEDFESDFLLAKEIPLLRERDAGLMHLVRKALQMKKREFTLKAIEFTLAMSHGARDEALRMIVDEALLQGHKDIARHASDKFNNLRNKARAKRKILEY